MSLDVLPTHVAIPPQAAEHTHTFILLHERGDNFVEFGQDLLKWRFHLRLPTVRFVLPASPKSRASASTQGARQVADNWLPIYILEGL